MMALFVKLETPEVKRWVYQGQTDDPQVVARFVRGCEQDMKLTKDMTVKTVIYKIVELDPPQVSIPAELLE